MSKAKKPLRAWRVIEIGKKGRHIATIGASSADVAIKKAIAAYGITDPHRQRRLVAQAIE